MAGVQGTVHRGEIGPGAPASAAGWGLECQELNTWDLLQPGRSPHRMVSATPTCRITGSTDQWGQAQEFPAEHIFTGERQKSSERALLPNTMSYTLPQALIYWKQLSREIRDRGNKGCLGFCPASAPRQSYCLHQAGSRGPFYTDWPLTRNRQLSHQKPYIIRNNLGQTKICDERAGKHSHHLPWKLNSTPWGWPSVLTHPVTP